MKSMRSITPTTRRSLPRAVALVAAAGVLSLGATACGSDSSSADTTTAASTTVATGEVTVTGQWARATAEGQVNGAAYFTITSPVDDQLVGAAVDATVAARTELHETVMAGGMGSDTTMGGGMGGGTTMPGGMTMHQVDAIELPAGTAVELKPGGYHVMFFDLVQPLKVGDTITLTLTLAKAGQFSFDVPVLDEAP